MTRATGSLAMFVGSASLVLCASCGTGVTDAILLASESGARTFVDILLSDFLSELPNLYTFPTDDGTPNDDGADNGGSNPDAGDPDDSGDVPDDTGGLVGVPADGETAYAANGCSACHCATGAACTEGLVSIEGIGATRLDEKLLGEGFHAGGKFPALTEQDIADLEAFLAG